mmetsp:Transcript_15874/g.31713  ORF Transcript_15874/g.31713 Transcript_15874/m.31713 type:complete len:415 (+) Transcript_15874:135-1379(+)
MDYQQRAYYDAMRRSQEASMRRSHEQQQQFHQQQRSSAPSNPYAGGGGQHGQHGYGHGYTPGTSRDSRDSRDSRGSRGSSEGLRMSGGAEMAGVGIFFQQEPNTGKVYVANIVQGGSADRSGVIRVNDVIVKVDDEDVQGQPLSTLRNLILGKQGSYVVLAFRRMTGTELYYFDVELVRGSPEYFESLKKSQAIADEKDKLINQVRQQEVEIQQLKQANTMIRTSASSQSSHTAPVPRPTEVPGGDPLARELEIKTQELQQMQEKLRAAKEDKENAASIQVDAESAVQKLRTENARLATTLEAAKASIDQIDRRLQSDQDAWNEEIRRLECAAQPLKTKISANANLEGENQRLKAELAQRKQRQEDAARKLPNITAGIEGSVGVSDESATLLKELLPFMDSLHNQMIVTFKSDK